MTSRNFSASAFSVPAAREIVRGRSGSRQMNREAMKNIPPADPDRVIAWEPITAVQVVAHRVARRRCFLVIAGVWSLTALASSIMFFSAGAVVGGCTFAATGCLIALASIHRPAGDAALTSDFRDAVSVGVGDRPASVVGLFHWVFRLAPAAAGWSDGYLIRWSANAGKQPVPARFPGPRSWQVQRQPPR